MNPFTYRDLFRDRAWLDAKALSAVSAYLEEEILPADDYRPEARHYEAGFELVIDGHAHCYRSETGSREDMEALSALRDAASVVSGMLAALVAAIDRLTAEKGGE